MIIIIIYITTKTKKPLINNARLTDQIGSDSITIFSSHKHSVSIRLASLDAWYTGDKHLDQSSSLCSSNTERSHISHLTVIWVAIHLFLVKYKFKKLISKKKNKYKTTKSSTCKKIKLGIKRFASSVVSGSSPVVAHMMTTGGLHGC